MASGRKRAVGRELGSRRDAGLEAERPLAHVAEAALRRDPQGAIGLRQDRRRRRAGRRRRRAALDGSTPKAPMRAKKPYRSQHRGVDRRVASRVRQQASAARM